MKSIGPYVVLREVGLEQEAQRSTEAVSEELTPVPAPRRRFSHTLWAADRLTGMPVLLHPLRTIAPMPQLPAHPRLLPFTDIVPEMSQVYLVTELPPQTKRATDPMQVARAALELLDFLHRRDLVHGSLDAAQLWDIDGEVRISGTGLPRVGHSATPGDDLRDLATALEDLGGLPPLLAALREGGARFSAHDLLDLLNAGLSVEQLSEAIELMPALSGETENEALSEENAAAVAELFSAEGDIVLGGALPDEVTGEATQPPEATQTPEQVGVQVAGAEEAGATENTELDVSAPTEQINTAQLNTERATEETLGSTPDAAAEVEPPVSETPPPMTLATPAFLIAGKFKPSEVTAPRTTASRVTPPREVGEWQRTSDEAAKAPSGTAPSVPPALSASGRPRVTRKAAITASERLKADHRRRLDLSILRRERTAAVLDKVQRGQLPTGNTTVDPDTLIIAPLNDDTPQERRRLENQVWEEQMALDRELAAARRAREAQHAAAKAKGLSGTNAPREVGEIQRRPKPSLFPTEVIGRSLRPIRLRWSSRAERLHNLSPRDELLRWLRPALAALLLAFAVATVPRLMRPAPAPCCSVAFQLRAAPEQSATLTLLNAPSGTGWERGRKLGSAPGTVNFPAAGTYRVKLNAEGYAPARVNVTVPTRDPVIVEMVP